MTTNERWGDLEKLMLSPKTIKNKELTYLHGIVYGLDYPRKDLEIQSANQDRTTYTALVFNTEKRGELPLKELLVSGHKYGNLELVRFNTTEPAEAIEFFKKYHVV